jgi:hypothetical protein
MGLLMPLKLLPLNPHARTLGKKKGISYFRFFIYNLQFIIYNLQLNVTLSTSAAPPPHMPKTIGL